MVSLTDIVQGEWYISIVCSCGERLLLFRDLNHGNGSLAGAFTITCQTCGTQGTYPAQHYKLELETNDAKKAVSRVLRRICSPMNNQLPG